MLTLCKGKEMDQRQSYSHGLLYSVAPEHFSNLHLNDESRLSELDWDKHDSWFAEASYAQATLSLLQITAAKWGIATLKTVVDLLHSLKR